MAVTSLSALTLGTSDMGRSIEFYQKLGFQLDFGGPKESFSTLKSQEAVLNLVKTQLPIRWWGRPIFYVENVDQFHRRISDEGLLPQSVPMDGPWGERYFHINDPDGHEISFAQPL